MGYYFFLSYANDNNDEDEVCQFFDDLSAEVCRQLGLKQNTPGIGFRDQGELKTGADWQLEMMTALQASPTLVCLYSPAYFKSRWCGCEWEVFRLRRNLYVELKRQSGEANPMPPHVIKPVIWMPGDVPEVASGIQIFGFETSDDTYQQEGLFRLIRRHEKYKDEYDKFIFELARDILREKNLLLPTYPVLAEGLLDQVKNPFVGKPAENSQESYLATFSQSSTPESPNVGKQAVFKFMPKRMIAVAIVLALALLLGGGYAIWPKSEPRFDDEAADDLFDKTVVYVGRPKWFWQSPGSVNWGIENIDQHDKRVIKGDRIGLFKTGLTKNRFNTYRDFVMVFDARFSGNKTTPRRIGWVIRAKDFDNYYLFELVAEAGDHGRKEFRASRYENGNLTPLRNPQVIENIDNPNDSFEIRTQVTADRFVVCIRPFFSNPPRLRMLVDVTDNTFSHGGIGFLPRQGNEFQLESLLVMPNPNLADEGCKP